MPKKREKPPVQGGYTTIKIPNDMAIEVDNLVGKHGFVSRTNVITEAVRDLFIKYKKIEIPRFEHFNVNDSGVRVTDRKIGLIAEIYFKPQGIFCDIDKNNDCEHINYALTVPAIQEIIRRKIKEGWKLPEPTERKNQGSRSLALA